MSAKYVTVKVRLSEQAANTLYRLMVHYESESESYHVRHTAKKVRLATTEAILRPMLAARQQPGAGAGK